MAAIYHKQHVTVIYPGPVTQLKQNQLFSRRHCSNNNNNSNKNNRAKLIIVITNVIITSTANISSRTCHKKVSVNKKSSDIHSTKSVLLGKENDLAEEA